MVGYLTVLLLRNFMKTAQSLLGVVSLQINRRGRLGQGRSVHPHLRHHHIAQPLLAHKHEARKERVAPQASLQ